MSKFSLSKISPSEHPLCKDKEKALKLTEELQKKMYDLLYLMFAHGKHSLLIILHGIDASGKDGTVRHIFSGANPQGIKTFSFKQPTEAEARHDFLWRCHMHTPESGQAAIFNRSYYEECLVVRVHPEILAKQKIPQELVGKHIWKERFEDITAFEKYLARNGTVVLKFFLNVSKQEQRERFLSRLDEPAKNWKFSMADIAERALWDDYQEAYQDMIGHTASKDAPWHVVPADHKWFARVVIGSAIVSALEKEAPVAEQAVVVKAAKKKKVAKV